MKIKKPRKNQEVSDELKQKIAEKKALEKQYERYVTDHEYYEKEHKTIKKEYKKKKKAIDDEYIKISRDIYSDSGINSDIADSIGVTLKAIDETY